MPSGVLWRAPATVAHRHGRADLHRRRAAGRRALAVDCHQAGRPAWPAGRRRAGCSCYRLVLAQRRRGSSSLLRHRPANRREPRRLGLGWWVVDGGGGLGGGDWGDVAGNTECAAAVAPVCGGVEMSRWWRFLKSRAVFCYENDRLACMGALSHFGKAVDEE